MAKRFEVRSELDRGIVFDANTIAEEARIRRITPRKAAQKLADENTDLITGEELYVSEEWIAA